MSAGLFSVFAVIGMVVSALVVVYLCAFALVLLWVRLTGTD